MSCDQPITIPNKVRDSGKLIYRYMTVPCGKCLGCKQDRQDSWIYRLFCEESTNKHSLFITLTYDPENLPLRLTKDDSFVRYKDYIKRKSIDDCVQTLFPDDLQKYFKRLRKYLIPNDLKYFACGEYGDDGRPHYHIALFYDINDPIQVEALVEDSWKMGFVTIEPLIFNRIVYVTKYITDNAIFCPTDPHQVNYFNRCSQGIGLQGYLNDSRYYSKDVYTTVLPNGKKVPLPRYFRKKFLISNFNTYDLQKSNENYDKRHANLVKNARQDAIIQYGSDIPEKIAKFADSHLSYERKLQVQFDRSRSKHKF